MWWIILAVLGVIFLIIICLLFARLVINIDSDVNIYKLSFAGLVSGRISMERDSIWLKFNIVGWGKDFDLIKPAKSKNPKPKEKPLKERNSKYTSSPINFKKVMRVIFSFKIKNCFVSIDTGNMPLNGILYPWFYMLSMKTGRTIMINFWGENTLILQIENTLARMLWAYIKS